MEPVFLQKAAPFRQYMNLSFGTSVPIFQWHLETCISHYLGKSPCIDCVAKEIKI